jgi:hypothetical protein
VRLPAGHGTDVPILFLGVSQQTLDRLRGNKSETQSRSWEEERTKDVKRKSDCCRYKQHSTILTGRHSIAHKSRRQRQKSDRKNERTIERERGRQQQRFDLSHIHLKIESESRNGVDRCG